MNNIGQTVDKIMQGLKIKLQRQKNAVAETQEHIGILEKQQGDMFLTPKK